MYTSQWGQGGSGGTAAAGGINSRYGKGSTGGFGGCSTYGSNNGLNDGDDGYAVISW